jgi:hypothetical protein
VIHITTATKQKKRGGFSGVPEELSSLFGFGNLPPQAE